MRTHTAHKTSARCERLGRLAGALAGIEDGFAVAVLGLIALTPIIEVVGREGFGHSVPGTIPIVQHMTLWITFLGAALASAPLVFGLLPASQAAGWAVPVGVAIIVGTALGVPIYAAIGGAALLLFWNEGSPVSAVPGETYRLSTSPMLPAIPLRLRELGRALWDAKWEVGLPVVILAGIFGGFVTLVEAAALAVLYAVVVECLVFRELRFTRDVTRVAVESATMVGGFMIILGVALGLTSYLIIAQIPTHALTWVRELIHSPYLFLLALNVLLIIVGALMDIYSAIIVIVPLIAPMAAAYDIDPIHLGVIFLANMQLGYLMPPRGENLFLSAYRFDQPLGRIYRSTFPYMVILLLAVLLITYVPPITLWLVRVSGI